MRTDLKTIITDVILNTAIIIMIFFGLCARFYSAKNGIGFFIDDLALIKQVADNSYLYLLTSSLDEGQVCPPLLLVMLKFLNSHFGVNHFALGFGSLISSCLGLIFMPMITYKICKNRFAVLISVFLLAFNSHILYYTQRIKHYSTDIFFTIFLIWIGFYFFSTPVNKRKMVLLTAICIICGLMSYPSIIVIASLWFYYLFLFKEDDVKSKIINFLIFIIPWLTIFIPYLIYIGIDNHNCGFMKFWFEYGHSHILNFEQLKLFIPYFFGDYEGNYKVSLQYDGHPYLTYCKYFWYLFVPIIIGTAVIFIKKDKYLFCVLVLPVITSQFLGIIHIYPCSFDRQSLWMIPIFIILFVIPAAYIKFNKKIIFCIISCIIIFYYLFLFDKATIKSIKNYFNDNYQQNTTNLYVENLLKSDISDNDIIFITQQLISEEQKDYLIGVFDKYGILNKNQKIYAHDNTGINHDKLSLKTENLTANQNIYFYIYKDGSEANCKNNLNYYYNMIKENMNIIYEYETWYGDKFIKARVIRH